MTASISPIPFISICIPAYKNEVYLATLLNSILQQTFKDFEVVISDDSTDDSVQNLIENYSQLIQIRYEKNIPAKGSPANWNHAIKNAKGKWIKIMHDDDWFASSNSLTLFAETALKSDDVDFIFSGYTSYKNGNPLQTKIPLNKDINSLIRSPYILFKHNFIGHPSTTLIRNDQVKEWYDENIKWVVDFEFYMRVLNTAKFTCIQGPLINIGMGEDQITHGAFGDPSIEIPENMYLLNKLGNTILNKLVVFDYYWRSLRNRRIRSINDMAKYVSIKLVPDPVKRMVELQKKIPHPILRVGVFSKIIMFLAFVTKKIS